MKKKSKSRPKKQFEDIDDFADQLIEREMDQMRGR